MRQLITLSGFVVAALALTGCVVTPTRVDTGAIRAKTYNFMYMGGDSKPTRPEIHAIIQAAIEKTLTAKGLTKVAKDGDVAVCYLIIISDGGKTQSINDYYGYGEIADNLEAKAHEAFAVENKNRTQFDAGTLVIDIAKFNPYQVFWRNFVYRPVLENPPVAEREAHIGAAVDEVLKNLRVAR